MDSINANGLAMGIAICYINHNMVVGVTIPVYHTSDLLFDFTRQTLESLKSEENEIRVYLVVNYSSPEYYPTEDKFKMDKLVAKFTVIDNPKGNSVSAAWNLGIKSALDDGCEYVMVLNNDLVLHHKCVDNLLKFADMHQEFLLWTASEWIDIRTLNGVKEADINWSFDEHPHFSFFMVNKKTIDTVGWFDENLKMAYFEDSDMHTRILLSGNRAGKTAAAKFYHYGSRTIKVDDDLYADNKKTYEENRQYVDAKWGIDFHNQVFAPPEKILELINKHPFNNPQNDLKSW
jgi:hypothetical protein